MLRFFAGLGVLGLGVSPIIGADMSADHLVERLASARYSDRASAVRELRALGEVALPALDRAARSADGLETRLQAGALAASLRHSAESARVIAAAPITLDYQGVPLATIVADLRARTGIPLALDPRAVTDPLRPVRLTSGPVTPWHAVDLLCRAAGLREIVPASFDPKSFAANTVRSVPTRTAYSMAEVPQLGPGEVPVVLADGSDLGSARDCRSAVRVSALPPVFSGNRVLLGKDQIALTLDVAPIPGLNWQSVEEVRLHRVWDDAGRPVVTVPMPGESTASDPYISPNMVFGGGFQPRWVDINSDIGDTTEQSNPRLVTVYLRTDGRRVHRLRRIDGVIVGQVVQRNRELIRVDDLLGSVGVDHEGPGDTRLTVLGYERSRSGTATIRVRAEYPNPWTMQRLGIVRGVGMGVGVGGVLPPPLDGVVSLGGVGRVGFADADGKTIERVSVSNSQMTDDGFRQTYEMEMTFPHHGEAGPPVRMVVTGDRPLRVEVPFRLDDVVLP